MNRFVWFQDCGGMTVTGGRRQWLTGGNILSLVEVYAENRPEAAF